jgi:hypothetical protein
MAINYLNSINLNQNELLQGVVENQPNDASAGASPIEGQLYFNTTAHVLKQYNGTAWAEVGGGVITLTLNDGTYIDVNSSGTAANPIFAPDLNAVDGTSVAGTRFLSKDNTWDVPTYPSDANTTYELFGVGSTNGTAGIQLDGSDATLDNVLIIGAGTTTVTRSANTLTVTSNDQYDGTVTSVAATHAGDAFTASIGNTSTINPSVDITMAGASTDYIDGEGNLTVFPAIPQGDVTGIDAGTYISIDDPNTATPTVNALGTTAATASRLVARDASGYGYVVTPASGDSSTKIPTTEWVNQKLTGLLEFIGGFNANTGDLDSPLTGDLYVDVAIAVGDYYVVSTAGNFFGNAATPLTPGDSVIVQTAKTAGNAAEVDFIVVQSDTDLATASTVGLGNVAPGGAIDVSYSSGTATVSVEDSTASNKGAVIVTPGTGISVAYASGTATVTNTDTNATNTNASGTIAIGALSGTATHNFNTKNTIVQTIDKDGDTVVCDITRTVNTCVATIATAQTAATGGIITILVQKIG